MRAGLLDTRITIERDETAASASGGKKAWTTPATVCTIWSEMKSVGGGSESFGNPDWLAAVGVYDFTVRYRTDITPKMRVKYGTRHFNIVEVRQGPTSEESVVVRAQEVD